MTGTLEPIKGLDRTNNRHGTSIIIVYPLSYPYNITNLLYYTNVTPRVTDSK